MLLLTTVNQVERTLYKLLASILQQCSPTFHGLFGMDQLKPEGQSDDNPIILGGISNAEFSALMDYMWQGCVLDLVLSLGILALTSHHIIGQAKSQTHWSLP